MVYNYKTQNTCSQNIQLEIEGDVVRNIVFTGGCNGNLKAISKLVDGYTAEEIEKKLLGNTCVMRNTSCADQLAKAVRKAYDETNK